MEPTSLTMPYATGDRQRTLAFYVAALCSLGGLLLALLLPALWPLAVSTCAALAFAWLMHSHPLVQRVEYFCADEDGLRYVHAPGPEGQVSHYKWTELRSVTAETGAGTPRLIVQTGRGALQGATVALPMPSAVDCQAAAAAATQWLSAYRL